MKLFVSQPMRDKTDEEISLERAKAVLDVTKKIEAPIIVMESFFGKAPFKDNPLWYLGESIKLLSEADVVYFCKDWEKYDGCTIEHECAVRYGKKCIYAN